MRRCAGCIYSLYVDAVVVLDRYLSPFCKLKYTHINQIFYLPANVRDKKTTTNSIKYRVNEENKFLYCKERKLNQQLDQMHLAVFAQLAVVGRGNNTCVYVIAIFTMCESTEQCI